MKRYIVFGVSFSLLFGGIVYALPIMTVPQGGTGQSTFTAGQLIYGSGANAIRSVATTSVSCSGGASCTTFTAIGASPVTITASGSGTGNVATSTNESKGFLSYWTSDSATPALLGKVATTSVSFSGPFTGFSALGALVGGSNSTITWTGLATTSQPSSSHLLVSNGGAGVYGVATSTLTPSSPLTGSFVQIGTVGSLGCQTASGSQAGCLSSADWTTFNSKVAATRAINTTYPLQGGGDLSSDRTLSLAFGTTTTNTWVHQIFSSLFATNASSTNATTTYLTVHNIYADASDGILFDSNSGTNIANFGAGNSANVTFYGGVNIDGSTRLATSLNGLLKTASGAISAATAGVDYLASYDAWTHPAAGQSATTSLMLFNGQASTTALSVYNNAWFGATATTTITSTGAIGVASSTPWGLLSVNPNALGSGMPEFVIGSSTETHFIVDGGGKVGIGTSTPGDPGLTIRSGSNWGSLHIINSTAGGASSIGLYDAGSKNGSADMWLFGKDTSANNDNFFIASGPGATHRFDITTGGNVGIGTTSPQSKFEIGDSANTGIQGLVTNSSSGTGAWAEFGVRNAYSTAANSLRLVTTGTGWTTVGAFQQNGSVVASASGLTGGLSIGAFASAPVRFYTGGSADANERMRIDSSGNVGIGTSTPQWALQVVSDTLPQITLDGTNAAASNWSFRGIGSNLYIATSSKATFATSTNTALTIIGTTGNVGISTSTPGSILSVQNVVNFVSNAVSTFYFGIKVLGTFILPATASESPTTAGQIALDTTSNQIKYGDGSATHVLGNGYLYPSLTYSTSTAWTGTTTIPLGTAFVAETWGAVQCFTDTGTLNVSIYDGTNRMNMFNASTTVGTVTLSTNNTFTATEKRYIDIGTPASSPTKISCTIKKEITND